MNMIKKVRRVETFKISLETCYKNNIFQWTKIHGPPEVGLAWPRVFLHLPRKRLEMAGIGNRGGACQLQFAHTAHSLTNIFSNARFFLSICAFLGRRRGSWSYLEGEQKPSKSIKKHDFLIWRFLNHTTLFVSRTKYTNFATCGTKNVSVERFLEPLPAHGAHRAPFQKPTHSEPSQSDLEPKANPSQPHQKRSVNEDHQNPSRLKRAINNDQKVLFFTLAQSKDHRQPPNCSPEADHLQGCRSMFFISCRFEHGREDCLLRVHICGPFTDEFVFHFLSSSPLYFRDSCRAICRHMPGFQGVSSG